MAARIRLLRVSPRADVVSALWCGGSAGIQLGFYVALFFGCGGSILVFHCVILVSPGNMIIGGRYTTYWLEIACEKVAGLDRNGWQLYSGITGRLRSEYAIMPEPVFPPLSISDTTNLPTSANSVSCFRMSPHFSR